MTVHVHPNFNATVVKPQYAPDKRVRIHSFLEEADATSIQDCLSRETRFASAFNIDGVNGVMSEEDMRQLTPDQVAALQQKIYQHASKGTGFLYGRNNITGPHRDSGPAQLQAFAEAINSDRVVQAVREISGHDDITCASAQATRYLPGNFLTRHNDFHPDEGRRVAYVMNFTREWHPDWGGLLQFYQQDGAPREAWTPQFNSLTLFEVSHVHAVTFVAPYALEPRFAITGWFRTKAL